MESLNSFWQLGDDLRVQSKVSEDKKWFVVATKLAEQTRSKPERSINLDLCKGSSELRPTDNFLLQEDNKFESFNFNMLNLGAKFNENVTKIPLRNDFYNMNDVYQNQNVSSVGTIYGSRYNNINRIKKPCNSNVNNNVSNKDDSTVGTAKPTTTNISMILSALGQARTVFIGSTPKGLILIGVVFIIYRRQFSFSLPMWDLGLNTPNNLPLKPRTTQQCPFILANHLAPPPHLRDTPPDTILIRQTFDTRHHRQGAETLPRNEVLGGYIFVCNNDTMQEDLKRQLFGLPPRYRDSVRAITPGLPLFLYNYTTHQLHGIFEAVTFGGSNIDPTAWEDKKCRGESRFPAQVRIRVRKLCKPMEEDAFRPVLHHYDGPKFRLELSVPETLDMLDLCEQAGVQNSVDEINLSPP
ncbi:hypothetical protein OROGR_022479 [Orobanche gracilis]